MKRKRTAAKKSSVRRVAKKSATRAVSTKATRTRASGSGKTRRTAHKPAAAAPRSSGAAKAQALAKYSQTGAPWWKAHL